MRQGGGEGYGGQDQLGRVHAHAHIRVGAALLTAPMPAMMLRPLPILISRRVSTAVDFPVAPHTTILHFS